MKLIYWVDKRGKHRWKLFADNNVQIGASTQGYKHKYDCMRNVQQIADGLAMCNNGGG